MNKNTILSIAIAVVIGVAGSSAYAAAPAKGSAPAAQEAVAQLLALTTGVPANQVKVAPPVIDGSTAQTTATVAGQQCNVSLARNDTLTQYGWEVTYSNCTGR